MAVGIDRSKKEEHQGTRNLQGAIEAVKEVATPGKDLDEKTRISMRISTADKCEIDSFFAKYGISLTRAFLISASYVEQLAKDGKIQLSAAGIIDNRK